MVAVLELDQTARRGGTKALVELLTNLTGRRPVIIAFAFFFGLVFGVTPLITNNLVPLFRSSPICS
jgi:hypothetical protein